MVFTVLTIILLLRIIVSTKMIIIMHECTYPMAACDSEIIILSLVRGYLSELITTLKDQNIVIVHSYACCGMQYRFKNKPNHYDFYPFCTIGWSSPSIKGTLSLLYSRCSYTKVCKCTLCHIAIILYAY